MQVWEIIVYIVVPIILVIILALMILWKRYRTNSHDKKADTSQTKSVEQVIEEFRQVNNIEPLWFSTNPSTPQKDCSTDYLVGRYTLTSPFEQVIQHCNNVLVFQGLKPKYTPVQQQGITIIDYDLSTTDSLTRLLEIPKESTFQVSIRSVRSLHEYMIEGMILVFQKNERLLSINMNLHIYKQELVSYFKLCATPYNQNSWIWSWFQSRPNIQTLLNITHINDWLLSIFSTQGIAPASPVFEESRSLVPVEAIWKSVSFASDDLRTITNTALQKYEAHSYPSTKTSIPDIIEECLHKGMNLPKDLVLNQVRKVLPKTNKNGGYYSNITLTQKTNEVQLYSIDMVNRVSPHIDLMVYKPDGTTDTYLFYLKVKYIITYNAKVMIYPNDKQVMVRIQHNLNSVFWGLGKKELMVKLGIQA
jgi:hypothetical protein